MHFLHKTFPGTLPKSLLTVPSFTAVAVLFPDCQKLAYVKQQDVALPLLPYSRRGFPKAMFCQCTGFNLYHVASCSQTS